MEVSKWTSREEDRGQEKPRWTRDRELKYGATMKKLQVATEKQIRNLHSVHSSVKSLEETLVRRMEQIREDIALRGSEDIRFFTYVTVVFLPLGFASGIFSMNGTPAPDLVNALVICAVVSHLVTILVTIFALFNAKTLRTILRRQLRGTPMRNPRTNNSSLRLLHGELATFFDALRPMKYLSSRIDKRRKR
ncbi:hypothetical protein GGS26DRAFT_582671 [Hypomontagnella submonticulosa]|nr:hypothetical protein GGS26DRAFT_582671 [Hypomontagnella submonticulosa]